MNENGHRTTSGLSTKPGEFERWVIVAFRYALNMHLQHSKDIHFVINLGHILIFCWMPLITIGTWKLLSKSVSSPPRSKATSQSFPAADIWKHRFGPLACMSPMVRHGLYQIISPSWNKSMSKRVSCIRDDQGPFCPGSLETSELWWLLQAKGQDRTTCFAEKISPKVKFKTRNVECSMSLGRTRLLYTSMKGS